MDEPIKVEKFGMHALIEPDFAEQDHDRIAGSLEATLTAQAEAQGFVVLPDTFTFEIREPNWLTPEEEAGGYTTRDYMRALASVKCYRKPEETTE